MTAQEIPVGGQFSILGDIGKRVYTVTAQVHGLLPYSHLTYLRYFDPWDEEEKTCAFAGHTEVIAHPPTVAADPRAESSQ